MPFDFELSSSIDQTIPSEIPRDFIGMSLPEQPNKFYFTLRSHRIVVEADLSIQNIMEKLQSYKSRVALVFEVSIPYAVFFLILLEFILLQVHGYCTSLNYHINVNIIHSEFTVWLYSDY